MNWLITPGNRRLEVLDESVSRLSTNGETVILEVDTRWCALVQFHVSCITNGVDLKQYKALDSGFADAILNTTINVVPGTNESVYTERGTYMRFTIASTVADSHGTLTLRVFGRQ